MIAMGVLYHNTLGIEPCCMSDHVVLDLTCLMYPTDAQPILIMQQKTGFIGPRYLLPLLPGPVTIAIVGAFGGGEGDQPMATHTHPCKIHSDHCRSLNYRVNMSSASTAGS